MSDPLGLVPFAIAAGGGRVAGYPAAQLVAAGVTLLQRAAPLVRALAGRRSALLLTPEATELPSSGAWLVALAASDGRGMVLLAPPRGHASLVAACHAHHIGAIFTTDDALAAWHDALPPAMPVVVLDHAPLRAQLQTADGSLARAIDLGTHFGIPVEGDPTVEGADEECVVLLEGDGALGVSHRSLLRAARAWPNPSVLDAAMPDTALKASPLLRALIAHCATLRAGDDVPPNDVPA